MKKMILLFFIFIPLLHAKMFQTVDESQATLVQTGKDARYCLNCGMDLVQWYKTSYSAKVDGKIQQFCSMHCLRDVMKHSKNVSDIKVVDVTSLKFIDAKKAYYVVGSKVRGTMSRISKYAFKKLSDAKAFKKKYGGKIMNFEQALKVADKDFRHYR